MNVATKIAKESTITFSGMLYGNINRYLYTALLARWVGPEYLGIYSLANAIMLISEVLAKMGLETGIMRFVSQLNPEIDGKKIRSIIGSALKMTIFSSCIIMFILIISSDIIVRLFMQSGITTPNIPLTNLDQTHRNSLTVYNSCSQEVQLI